MVKQMNMVTGSVLTVLAAGLMGCGQGFKSNGVSDAGAQAVNIQSELAKAEEASHDAQTAMAEAEEALKAIQDENGNINLGLFMKSSSSEVQAQGLLSPIVDKLRTVFNTVFVKIETVKAKFTAARTALLTALGRLDHTDPVQAAMISEITAQLGKIDAMEAQFRVAMQMLAGKLDLAVTALDKVISGLTSFIPGWGWLVNLAVDYVLMTDIKAFIAEIKMRLLAL